MKVKLFEIVTDCDKIDISKCECVFGERDSIRDWAYIIHDKDETRPHFHICCRLKDSYDTKYIAQWFDIGENFVSKVKGKWSDMLKYLTHANAPSKHQYDESLVFSNFDWISERDKPSNEERKQQIVNSIVDGSIREFNYTKYISAIEYDKYRKNIENAFRYRCDLIKGEDRQMECIFLRGDSGVGKTSFAKKLAKDKGYSVYVSSGSNDILDDYKGQDCIILDDLRPSVMGLSDLLKMLDNNTTSTVKSRYKNKVLECKLIIITTVLDIDTFFHNVFTEENETCVQLKRRCKTYIEMTSTQLFIKVWQDFSRRYSNPVIAVNPISSMFVPVDLDNSQINDFVSSFLNVDIISDNDDCLEPVEVQQNFPF